MIDLANVVLNGSQHQHGNKYNIDTCSVNTIEGIEGAHMIDSANVVLNGSQHQHGNLNII